MRTSKTLTISLPLDMLRAAEDTARRENRTMSELVREALRRYQQPPQAPAGNDRLRYLDELRQAVEELRAEARISGAGSLTSRRISQEINTARRQRRNKAPATKTT